MVSPVIGLIGVKGSGQTTITHHLVEAGFTEVAFADCLKESLCTLLGLDRTHFHDHPMKDQAHGDEIHPEEMMQKYGDFLKTLFGPDVFLDAMYRKLQMLETPVVITDIQSRAEADCVRSIPGSRLYRLVRDTKNHVLEGDRMGQGNRPHPPTSESQKDVITCDATIYNTGVCSGDLYDVIDTEIESLGVVPEMYNRCIQCGTDLGACNPRQLCGKTVCDNDPDDRHPQYES